MIILLVSALLTVGNLQTVHSASPPTDSTPAQEHPATQKNDSSSTHSHPTLFGTPAFTPSAALDWLLSSKPDTVRFARTLDSLLRSNPFLKTQFLRDLLLQSNPRQHGQSSTAYDWLLKEMDRQCTFSPFEKMSLIAKNFELYHPPAQTMKSYQIDIIQTILWLNEIF